MHRALTTDVENAIRGAGGSGIGSQGIPVGVGQRRPRQHAQNPVDDILDKGEVASVLSVVEDLQRLPGQNLAAENHRRHVWTPPGTIDREEAQPCCGQLVEVAVGVRHQLIGLFRGGVQRHRVIHAVADTEGLTRIAAIDRAAAGVDQVLHRKMPATLEHIAERHQVGGQVGLGVRQ